MPEVVGIEKLFSVIPKKRFSKFRLFGTSQFGHSDYGQEDIFFIPIGYGNAVFGVDKYADIILLSGIYRTDNVTGKIKFYREPFYITKNPRYANQQTNRAKMAVAVLAYQGLTSEEKMVYHKAAYGKRMSGYDLFLKEYLSSH